jgi:hypothetical protein
MKGENIGVMAFEINNFKQDGEGKYEVDLYYTLDGEGTWTNLHNAFFILSKSKMHKYVEKEDS